MTFLTDDERAYLKAQHKRERDRRICGRIKAVLLFDRGWSAASIAEALLLSEDAIRDHISEYKGSKKPALVPGKANEEEQKKWLAEYERLKQNLSEDETIGFIDGVHPTHNVQPAYG